MNSKRTVFRLATYFIKYKWRILAGLFSVAMMSAGDTVSAYLVARLFEVLQAISQDVQFGKAVIVPFSVKIGSWVAFSTTIVGRDGSFKFITAFALVAVFIIFFKVLFVYVREYMMSSVQQKILARFRTDLFDRIVLLPIKFFDANKTGYIMSRITNDVNNLEQSINMMVEIVQNIVYIVVFSVALMYTSWQLTLGTLAIFAVSGQVIRMFRDKIRSYSKAQSNTLADITSFLQERVSAIRIVKSFTREHDEQIEFRKKVGTNYHYAMKMVRVIATLSPTNELFNTFATSVLIIFCGYLFIGGSMTIQTMIFFFIVMINFAKPVKSLGDNSAKMQKSLVSAGYVFELLDTVPEPILPGAIQKQFRGEVEFHDVSFAYNDDVQALKHISFHVNPGEKIALVGPSGSGKSTLVNLISRFYDWTDGDITIDGISTRAMDLFAMRSQIAIVPQDVLLFSGTIRENIRYGRLEATEEEIIEAAKIANAHDFILNLDHGYETEVGERGVQISGGQRQRIAIARAVLRNPRILLLDEATSALDAESEQLVQEALDRLMKGRTSFIIAHRLATIMYCDKIVVLENGSLVEMGTNDELLQKSAGLYKRLHALQFNDAPDAV